VPTQKVEKLASFTSLQALFSWQATIRAAKENFLSVEAKQNISRLIVI